MEDWSPQDFGKYDLEKSTDRLDFIRKVYCILTAQLALTSIFVAVSASVESYRDFISDNVWFFILAILLSLVTMLVLFFVESARRTVPYNYILLFLFTGLEGCSVSCVTAYYDPDTILLAAASTCGLTLALTIYAFNTKTDFTLYGGILIALSFGLLIFGLIFIFIGDSNAYRLIFCPVAIASYGIYLVYDTQLIVGEKRHKIGYDEYILGAIALYIDIIGIFLYILELFGRK